MPAEGEPKTAIFALLAAFGTISADFHNRTMHELLEAGCRGTPSQPFEEWDVNGALAAMHGIAPRDEIEGMLAAQMVAVHSAAMRCLRQLKGSDILQQQDSNGSLAVKLLRTYTMQMEALQRRRTFSSSSRKSTTKAASMSSSANIDGALRNRFCANWSSSRNVSR